MNNDVEKVTEIAPDGNNGGFVRTQLNRMWLTFAPVSYLKRLNRKNYGVELDIRHPETFREKLNWLKVYYNDPLVSICLDKYRVRTYIESLGLGHILNDCFGVYPNFSWVMFDELPESFSFTATHGRDWRISCRSIDELDFDETRKYFSRVLRQRYHIEEGAKAYYFIKPRIMAERYLDLPRDGQYTSYSVMCFNGKPEYFLYVNNDNNEKTYSAYNLDMTPAPFYLGKTPDRQPKVLKVPFQLNRMIEYSAKIARPFPYARVSFFIVDEEIIFDTIDFFDDVALGSVYPDIFNRLLGEKITLPRRKGVMGLFTRDEAPEEPVYPPDIDISGDIAADVAGDISAAAAAAAVEAVVPEAASVTAEPTEAVDDVPAAEDAEAEAPKVELKKPDMTEPEPLPEEMVEPVEYTDDKIDEIEEYTDTDEYSDDTDDIEPVEPEPAEEREPFGEKLRSGTANAASKVKSFFGKCGATVASWRIGEKLGKASRATATWVRNSSVACKNAIVKSSGATWSFLCRCGAAVRDFTVKHGGTFGRATAKYAKITGKAIAKYAGIAGRAIAKYSKIIGSATVRYAKIAGRAIVKYAKIAGKAIAKYSKIIGRAIAKYSKLAWEFTLKTCRTVGDKIKELIDRMKNRKNKEQ